MVDGGEKHVVATGEGSEGHSHRRVGHGRTSLEFFYRSGKAEHFVAEFLLSPRIGI